MGRVKEMWMQRIENTTEDFAFGRITQEEAINTLIRLGIDADEAQTMLTEATS